MAETFVVAVALLGGWFARMWWETRHPRYVIVPGVSEDDDGILNMRAPHQAMRVAADLAERGDTTVRVPAGTYTTGATDD